MTTSASTFSVRESAGSGWTPLAGHGSRRWPERALRFPLGRIVATPGALAAFEQAGESPLSFLTRHGSGDWGALDEQDREANERGVRSGERILSAYLLRTGERMWVITEADRSVTTLLLPSEY
jgi:hypothetical protein